MRDGLQDRIFSTQSSADSVDVGPLALNDGSLIRLAGLSYRMSLYGTMGPPNFDRASGTRVSPTSAWCMQTDAGGNWGYQADGLIYDPESRTFSDPSGGVPQCLAGY
jgi:hypothetical protein